MHRVKQDQEHVARCVRLDTVAANPLRAGARRQDPAGDAPVSLSVRVGE